MSKKLSEKTLNQLRAKLEAGDVKTSKDVEAVYSQLETIFQNVVKELDLVNDLTLLRKASSHTRNIIFSIGVLIMKLNDINASEKLDALSTKVAKIGLLMLPLKIGNPLVKEKSTGKKMKRTLPSINALDYRRRWILSSLRLSLDNQYRELKKDLALEHDLRQKLSNKNASKTNITELKTLHASNQTAIDIFEKTKQDYHFLEVRPLTDEYTKDENTKAKNLFFDLILA